MKRSRGKLSQFYSGNWLFYVMRTNARDQTTDHILRMNIEEENECQIRNQQLEIQRI